MKVLLVCAILFGISLANFEIADPAARSADATLPCNLSNGTVFLQKIPTQGSNIAMVGAISEPGTGTITITLNGLGQTLYTAQTTANQDLSFSFTAPTIKEKDFLQVKWNNDTTSLYQCIDYGTLPPTITVLPPPSTSQNGAALLAPLFSLVVAFF
eukprot:TRINITY_DN383_c0_g1_i1.p1 TRINITY_DN383_c0_g1~~TRINITY_DN383_c0_g1_i1.p1  ORF type:complete len:156 (+),score=49.72 TRINITY_DN383_c0_g1_i1:148-615(+)